MNYKQVFAIKKQHEKAIKELCPRIENKSGLYFYTREENGFKFAYIGKAKHLVDRLISHSMSYAQHIDKSLKTRKLWKPDNITGWKIHYMYFPENELDDREKEYILKAHREGYQLYNVETGGTTGKADIGERKQPKTYRQGLEQGRKNASKEVYNLFDKHLDFNVKKENKNTEKAFRKFIDFLEYHKGGNEVE